MHYAIAIMSCLRSERGSKEIARNACIDQERDKSILVINESKLGCVFLRKSKNGFVISDQWILHRKKKNSQNPKKDYLL